MTDSDVKNQVKTLLDSYDPAMPVSTADGLREVWLQFDPKSIEVIKAELRQQQETVGISIPTLKSIAKELARHAMKNVDDYIPLTRLLWDEYGREGRVVALIPLGKMELAEPDKIVPILLEMCRTCLTWEDCDRLAMDALEPIVRAKPDIWLEKLEPWITDENKWVRRAAITVVGRLAWKQVVYIDRCLEWCERLMLENDMDIKRAVSFAIRMAARGDVAPVFEFLEQRIPPENAAATWVLCDVIRSMAKKMLPKFHPLVQGFEAWLLKPGLNNRERKSVESALKCLQN